MPVPKLKELKEKLSKDSSQIRDDAKLDEERGFQADNVGPFQIGTINGCKYVAIFVDKKENYTYYELNNNETGFPAKLIRNALEFRAFFVLWNSV